MDDDVVAAIAAFIGFLLAVAAYLGFCYAVILFALVPAFPFLVLGGGVLGALLVAGVLVATWLGVGAFAAPLVTPAAGVRRLPKSRTRFPRDKAWANYLFAQWRDDLVTAWDHIGTALTRVWRPARMVGAQPAWLVAWPLLLLPLVVMLAVTGGAAVAGVVAGLAIGAVLASAWLAWLAAAGALRGVDAGIRRLRGAKATCSRCAYRNVLPAYRCACGEVHHDIRGGRLGTFARRCDCGRLLPTTVLKAIAGLAPHCQDCGSPLRGNAGAVTDISLPVFGPANAGKTRFILAGMVALERHLRAVGGAFSTIDPESELRFRDAVSIVRSRVETAKTAVDAPQVGVTVLLGHGQRTAHLHLYDAAGELFTNREQNSDLRFLDDAEGLIFVLDPFSIRAVRDELVGGFAPRLALANPADMDPEQSYLVTTQRLGNQGVRLRRKSLAVAVVKSDLLLGLPCAAPLGPEAASDSVQEWLEAVGLENLVSGVSRDFDEVRYFLVSSLDDAAGRDGAAAATSAARPLLWLLGRSKMPLPSGAEAVTA